MIATQASKKSMERTDMDHESPASSAAEVGDGLTQLGKIDREIAEEDLPQVSSATKKEAGRIIDALQGHPMAPTVYPTQDGEIAIHFKSPGSPNAMVILLNNEAGAECYSHTGGRNRHAHYDDSCELPDDFVRAQLRRLEQLALEKQCT